MLPPEDRIVQHRVTDEERERLGIAARHVFASHGWIGAAYLYGSAARGGRPSRDIDIGLVPVTGDVPWDAPAHVAASLAEASGIQAIPFDIRLLAGASPVFLANLLSEGTLIYEAAPEARIRFEAEALSRWLDFRPAYERVRGAVLEKWSRG